MRIFYQKSKTNIKTPTILKNVFENDEGFLIIELLESSHKKEMDKYLNSLICEFTLDDIKDSFSYTYDGNSLSYTIKPINVTIAKMIGELDACNLLVPEPNSNPTLR